MAGGQLRLAGQPEPCNAEEEIRPVGYSEPPAENSRPLLGGYCPVRLCEREQWARGDSRCQAVYEGRTYFLSGPAEQQRFLASPERYAPARGGNDPVLEVEEGRRVGGKLTHTAIYNQRLYLFASPATLALFRQDPQRYVPAGQQ
jgi:YHS domain-containing protein